MQLTKYTINKINHMYGFFNDTMRILKSRSKIVIGLTILLFVASILYGLLSANEYNALSENEKVQVRDSLKPVFDYLSVFEGFAKRGEYVQLTVLIFLNNIKSNILLMLGGLIFLPIPFFLLSNGFLIGFLFGTVSSAYSILEMIGIVIVFLLETVSIILASTEGFYLGVSLFFPRWISKKRISRKNALLSTGKQSIKILALIALLLILAAVIEVLTIYSRLSRA